jgi:predicted SAM-dependent methyltransferase
MNVNLGCGGDTPNGWINVDFGPGAKLSKVPVLRHLSRRFFSHDWDDSIFIHDLRNPLPWEDNTVDNIYSAHTFEHLTKDAGERLTFETFRVLQPGGVLRVVVPDLGHTVGLYTSGELDATDFLTTLSAVDTQPHSFPKRIFSLFAGSGHRCMYDSRTLTDLVNRAGFIAKSMSPLESAIPDIANVERPDRTVNAAIVEGIKPSGPQSEPRRHAIGN